MQAYCAKKITWYGLAMKTCIDDPRSFADVLKDFMARHGGTTYAVAKAFQMGGQAPTRQAVDLWVKGGRCGHENAYRALMDHLDARLVKGDN